MTMKRKSCMDGFFGEYFRQSTLHGAKYIGTKDVHFCEKFFWIVAILSGMVGASYMVAQLIVKYNENPVYISFQPKETTIAQIPFPAVTICNVNILKAELMQQTVSLLIDRISGFYDGAKTKEEQLKKLLMAINLSEHMTHYCLAAPSFRRTVNATLHDVLGNKDVVQQVYDIIMNLYDAKIAGLEASDKNYTETPEVRKFLNDFRDNATHNCDDMILKCMWSRKVFPCHKLFHSIRTQYGSCCVYNMMPKFILRMIKETDRRAQKELNSISEEEITAWRKFTTDSLILNNGSEAAHIKFPKHQTAGGKPYGLSVLINPELDVYSSCNTHDGTGFKLVAHSPISYPNIVDYGVSIPPRSEVFVSIDPEVTMAEDTDLMPIAIDKRSCYFPGDEKANLTSYKFYTSTNCVDECIAKKTYEICNCVRYFMPRNSTQSLCGAKMLDCSEEVRKNLTENGRKGECSECKPACTEIKYNMQLSHFPLREHDESIAYSIEDHGINQTKSASNYSIVHIFLGTDSMYAKERKRLFDTFDLIASAGGLLSLALGVSIISLVEFLYFFTLRVYFQRREERAEAEEEEDEDTDYYSRSSGGERRLSSIVRPRIMDGLPVSDKMTGYYNWAMAATNNATDMMHTKSKDNPVSSQQTANPQKIPMFQVLRRESDEQRPIKLFYMS